jgi:tRNA(Ile2) C34 agmatinyltransferase TiaS
MSRTVTTTITTTVTLPRPLYEKARQVAEQTRQRVDEVIRAGLEVALNDPVFSLPADEQTEMKAMAFLSDEALFNLMREQMPGDKAARMAALMDANTAGTLREAEHAELDRMVEDGQRLMLRKAAAFDLLTQRGHLLTLDALKADGP